MIGFGKGCLRDAEGSVTVELALLAPVLALMVIGITDISIAYGQKLELEQGAQRAIEKVMQTTGETTVADTLQQEVVCQVNGTVEGACATGRVSAADVSVGYRLECIDEDGNRTPHESDNVEEFDALACGEDEREARYLSVTVVDEYTPMFPIPWTGNDGVFNISATAGMRTQ